ncbi:MAG: PDZ domain-containing protein [Kofleriaceae bacterium]
MSDEQAENVPETVPVLRREALLPTERNRGFGTVAVVCTMAGVASGLALATTLMAMQVADSMATRSYAGYRAHLESYPERGFLGIRYNFRDGFVVVDSVVPGTPAEQIALRRGDRLVSINGDRVDSTRELQQRIFGAAPGTRPILMIEREGQVQTLRPTLISWPVISY